MDTHVVKKSSGFSQTPAEGSRVTEYSNEKRKNEKNEKEKKRKRRKEEKRKRAHGHTC